MMLSSVSNDTSRLKTYKERGKKKKKKANYYYTYYILAANIPSSICVSHFSICKTTNQIIEYNYILISKGFLVGGGVSKHIDNVMEINTCNKNYFSFF